MAEVMKWVQRGALEREEAERELIQADLGIGSFLFRTKPPDFIVAVVQLSADGVVGHFRIRVLEGDLLSGDVLLELLDEDIFEGGGISPRFTSLESFIEAMRGPKSKVKLTKCAPCMLDSSA